MEVGSPNNLEFRRKSIAKKKEFDDGAGITLRQTRQLFSLSKSTNRR